MLQNLTTVHGNVNLEALGRAAGWAFAAAMLAVHYLDMQRSLSCHVFCATQLDVAAVGQVLLHIFHTAWPRSVAQLSALSVTLWEQPECSPFSTV